MGIGDYNSFSLRRGTSPGSRGLRGSIERLTPPYSPCAARDAYTIIYETTVRFVRIVRGRVDTNGRVVGRSIIYT